MKEKDFDGLTLEEIQKKVMVQQALAAYDSALTQRVLRENAKCEHELWMKNNECKEDPGETEFDKLRLKDLKAHYDWCQSAMGVHKADTDSWNRIAKALEKIAEKI